MTPERWEKIKEVLAGALECPRAERARYLDQSCAGDAELRGEVDLLLESESAAEGFLDQTHFSQTTAALLPEESNPWIGRRVGPYQIVEQIGSGGMGEVYRARRDDDQYRQEVALKVVRAGQDSRLVIHRFKTERQILASLEHPNIARLLDGGTTPEGTPYLVMELIHGEPIGTYCDKNNLPISDRLKIFLKACAAVQFAHQRLIIHRDIKPSNLLVTAEGVPKLLDFGIAKVLGADAPPSGNETLTAFRALTPEYASPEQITGEPVTTASDIYSLGLVLYDLLTGCRPYPVTRNPQELATAICHHEPERPSSTLAGTRKNETGNPEEIAEARGSTPSRLQKQLQGDLDNIALMALRKEPHRRYVSVEQFAADISRHLDNLPIVASRGTWRYRASKFIVRHKAAVAAGSAICLALVIGFAVALHEANIARTERARAEQRFNDMRQLARSNLFEFHDAIQTLPGSATARNLVIQRALGYLDKLSRDEPGNRDLMHELVEGYVRVASLQDNFNGPGIGDAEASAESYRKAFTLQDSLTVSSGYDSRELKAECDLMDGYLVVLMENGKTEEASRVAERGLAITERLVQQLPSDREAVMDEAQAHLHMSWVKGGLGSSNSTRELPEAIRHNVLAIQLMTPLLRQDQASNLVRAIMRTQVMLSYHLRKNRNFDESLRIYNALGAATKNFQSLSPLAQCLLFNYRSRLHDDMGNVRQAAEDDRKALAVAQGMLRADPLDLNSKINAAMYLGGLGMDEARLGDKIGGKKKLDEAIAAGEQLLANQHESFYQNLLLMGYAYQAEILSSMGQQEQAQAKYSQALRTTKELSQKDPIDLESRLNSAKLHVDLGVVLARAKQFREAQEAISTGVAGFEEFLRARPTDADGLYASAIAHSDLDALSGCVAGQECVQARSMRLLTLNN